MTRAMLALSLAVLLTTVCSGGGDTIPLTIRGETLRVELAVTDAEKVRGLMYRKSLAANGGMLFVYERPEQVAYWMKNTFIPLSIAFIDSERHILNISDMTPNNSVRTYPSRGPCQYVLEVNQGWFAEHGVVAGDLVTFELPVKPR